MEVSSTISDGGFHLREQLAFGGDAVQDPAVALQRVRAAALLKAAHQGVVAGVQEEHPEGHPAGGQAR